MALVILQSRIKVSGPPREHCPCACCERTRALMRALEKTEADLARIEREAQWNERKKPGGHP